MSLTSMFMKSPLSNAALSCLFVLMLLGCQAPPSRVDALKPILIDAGEADNLVLFQPESTPSWRPPRLFVEYKESNRRRYEWLCWSALRYSNANACVTYQTSESEFGDTLRRPREAMEFFWEFRWITAVEVGEEWSVLHPLGATYALRFHDGPTEEHRRKNCVAFVIDLGSRKRSLDAWYCNPRGEPLEDSLIEQMIASVGIRGEYVPEGISYPAKYLPPKLDEVDYGLPAGSKYNVKNKNNRQICDLGIGNRWEGYENGGNHRLITSVSRSGKPRFGD